MTTEPEREAEGERVPFGQFVADWDSEFWPSLVRSVEPEFWESEIGLEARNAAMMMFVTVVTGGCDISNAHAAVATGFASAVERWRDERDGVQV
jgi:hypothetical protein